MLLSDVDDNNVPLAWLNTILVGSCNDIYNEALILIITVLIRMRRSIIDVNSCMLFRRLVHLTTDGFQPVHEIPIMCLFGQNNYICLHISCFIVFFIMQLYKKKLCTLVHLDNNEACYVKTRNSF